MGLLNFCLRSTFQDFFSFSFKTSIQSSNEIYAWNLQIIFLYMLTLDNYYKSLFGTKTYKISLNSTCTCPNRDGTAGTGGCIFCNQSGSGDFMPSQELTLSEQIEAAKIIIQKKIRNPQNLKYIVYFQNFSATYGQPKRLKKLWTEAIRAPGVVGLALGTRPDCLAPEILSILAELAEKTYIQIELGLQTSNEKSAEYINRCYKNEIYLHAVENLHKANPKIHVVTHIIFGLPSESQKDMLYSVRFAISSKTDGIKITNLYVLKNTRLEKEYLAGTFKTLDYEEYFNLIRQALPLLPENIVVHRLTGDPPRASLLAPAWCTDKKRTMNEVKSILSAFCG